MAAMEFFNEKLKKAGVDDGLRRTRAMTNAGSETAIRTIVEARSNAVRTGDVRTMMADVADDVVIFDLVDPLRRRGKAALRQRLEQWVASYEVPPQWESRGIEVVVDGDVAFSYGLGHVSGTLKTGSAINMWFRSTQGWRRMGGRWQIVHDHGSVPFDPESGKASLALEPTQGDEHGT